jgi:hypothetical protein
MKINGVEILGKQFAYDNCHKIYIIEDNEDLNVAKDCGYDIFDITELEDKYNNSCSLKFISNWKLDKEYVRQFEENVEFEVL